MICNSSSSMASFSYYSFIPISSTVPVAVARRRSDLEGELRGAWRQEQLEISLICDWLGVWRKLSLSTSHHGKYTELRPRAFTTGIHMGQLDQLTHPMPPTIDPSTHRTHRHPSIHPEPNIPFIRHYPPFSAPFFCSRTLSNTLQLCMTNISRRQHEHSVWNPSSKKIRDRSAGSYIEHR